MSLHISFISFPGDGRDAVGAFLAQCEYVLTASPSSVVGLENLHQALSGTEDKGVVFHDGRTTIIDPEMVLMQDEEAMVELSRQFSPVVAMACEDISNTHGFSVYRDGAKVRCVLVMDGEVLEEIGAPLPEEEGCTLAKMSESMVLEILSRLGFDLDALENARECVVHHLAFTATNPADIPAEEPEAAEPPAPVSGSVKPWWQFW